MPHWITQAVVILVAASWIPLAGLWVTREMPKKDPRPSLIPDMDSQEKYKSQQANMMFNDKRADRQTPFGTVARGELRSDRHFYEGIVSGAWAASLPSSIAVNEVTLQRGKERYDIYCAPCHGFSGHGDGMVAVRAQELMDAGADMSWTPPKSMHDPVVRTREDGYFFGVITNGVRNMPAYGPQIKEADRWAIVLYIRALQKTQAASISDVAGGQRGTLELSRDEAITRQEAEAAPATTPADGSPAPAPSGGEAGQVEPGDGSTPSNSNPPSEDSSSSASATETPENTAEAGK
jgi:mono/diheme cytochrome c family protein